MRHTYRMWPKEQSYLDKAVELLLGSKKLGTAYSMISTLPAFQTQVSAQVLEKMLDEAVVAKDRKRVAMSEGSND